MARNTEEIFNEIVAAKDANLALGSLNSNSAVAIWRLWAYITAAAIHVLEVLFDLFKADVQQMIDEKTPASIFWYRQKALEFKHGVPLMIENGKPFYPPFGPAPLLAQCSVREAENGLVIKIAKENAGDLSPVSNDQLNAFIAYMNAVKYAGTPIRYINSDAVRLYISLDVYYDPLLLYSNGEAIIENNFPVTENIEDYLRKLSFDGRITRNELLSAIRNATGVRDAAILELLQQTAGKTPEAIVVYHIPDSGYFKVESLNITYKAYV